MMLYPTGEFTTAAYTMVIHQRDVYAAVFTTDDFTKKKPGAMEAVLDLQQQQQLI